MKIRHIIFILLSLLLASCSTENGRMLLHADSVMEQSPDSAMTILSRIQRITLDDSDLPYYALLYTQAQVKTDVPLDSDSLISIAYARYGSDTRGDLGIRSNFYTGEVYFNRTDYREAMRYYLTAYEESKRLDNDYWRAKAAERIADLFFGAYNYDEAAEYSQEAADLFKRLGRHANNRYTLVQLASIYLNNGNAERAYILLDSLKTLSMTHDSVDSTFIDYIKFPLIDAMMQTGRIQETEVDDIDFSTKDMSDLEILDIAILKSRVYNAVYDACEIKDVLKDVRAFTHSKEDTVHLLYARYQNAKIIGDKTLALSLSDSILYYQNEVVEDIILESVKGEQRDFYSDMAVRNETKSIYFKKLLWISICASVLMLAFLIGLIYFRTKAHKSKLAANLESFMSLKAYSDRISREIKLLEQSISEKDSQRNVAISKLEKVLQENGKHTKVIEKLFKEKWATLDTLCDQYFGLNNSELNAKDLVNNMEKELKKIVSKKGLADIVSSVDTYMGGIVTNLRNQCPFLKEDDVNFLALLYAGFSVRAVCMFTGIKYPHFYVKKSRLVKRIQASDAPDKDLFIAKLK